MNVCEAPLFVEPADSRGWFQLNVGLWCASGSLRDAAWPLFEGLRGWLAQTRQRGALEHWFVRKPPALRLRVRGAGFDDRAREQLASLLQSQHERGLVTSWGFTTYEPEVARLGGPVGIELVHTWLSESADLWLEWERLSRSGATRLGPDLMASVLYGELLQRSLGASEEVWDVWLALCRVYDRTAPSVPAHGTAAARGLHLDAIARLASAAEQALLERGRVAADAFGAGLARAHDDCTLEGGRRALLGTMASFLFNSWCLPPQTIAQLCRRAVHELDPRMPVNPRAPLELAR